MLLPKSLIFEGKTLETKLCLVLCILGSELFGTSSKNLQVSSKSSDVFGNLQKWSCLLRVSWHSQDKNCRLIVRISWQVYRHVVLSIDFPIIINDRSLGQSSYFRCHGKISANSYHYMEMN